MKKNELKTARGKATTELEKELGELLARKNDLKFDLAAGKVKNIREIHKVKKDIAQRMTLLHERSTKTTETK